MQRATLAAGQRTDTAAVFEVPVLRLVVQDQLVAGKIEAVRLHFVRVGDDFGNWGGTDGGGRGTASRPCTALPL